MNIADRGKQERESRAFQSTFELRAESDDVLDFHGVASVVDTPYMVRDIWGEYQETIVAGAFRKTLKEKDDVRLLVNHDGIPLARTASKTLKLSASPDLAVEASLDGKSPLVQTLRSAMDRGDMDQMSIGMRVHRQEWNEDYTERWIREAQLFDVSVVTFPASPTTSAAFRSLDETIRELTADTESLDQDEVRRVIAHLETLLRKTEPEFDPMPLMRMRLELAAKKPAA